MHNTISELNVLYSSDDNYAQHMGVSVQSLLKNNSCFEVIRCFVIDNQISEKNKQNITTVISAFKNAEIHFISFEEWKKRLNLNMSWTISITAYARLFVAEILPDYIEKILYLDCDTIICNSLLELWNAPLDDFIIGAVQDCVNSKTKTDVGMATTTKYFNSGMLLIDLIKWREQSIGKKCIDFIDNHEGNVTHHDQGTLNGVFNGNVLFLPLKFNLMTIYFFFNRKQMLHYYSEDSVFYSEKEIMEAKSDPVIIHFTPSFTSRPWIKNCKHPLRYLYWDSLSNTPWKDAKPLKSFEKWYVKIINWRYRTFKI